MKTIVFGKSRLNKNHSIIVWFYT